LQLFDQVRQLVSARRLRPGDQLPTVRELAIELGVNFNTVARAYRLMARAGMVSAQRGRGTYILDARRNPPANGITLRALTSHYIAEMSRQGFSAPQITSAVARQLAGHARPGRAGENHG